ncbi:dephospho-CoA kinase [Parabacteroides sp. PFB2-12]|uniref:dephospho-CoA kinase n=1 Tax=unclassified Parabacteroides TaxID=2649774 RepID=UPI0024735FFF|nr:MULTISPECIES: dephospho-CoA kinase [unclassified Parabacteroides]MDH6342035.1 dephospho-CoA kinase [Parabacteroides sp. PM6-13]MDH6389455.1 dephospho-CoA kinase [Parabacteroides sp. PFB2-12]
MKTIGITGGIGSGKTVVATLLGVMGIPVYIADEESKKLTDSSPIIREQLTALFGSELYTPEGLNRPLLASHIFGDPERLEKVNAIIHPEVNRHFLQWVKQQESDLAAIESAILFESGFDRIVDVSLMVYAPQALRIERACRRNAVSREEVERRIQSQLSDEIKKEKANYVIYNDDLRAIIPQTEAIIAAIRQG